MWMWGDGLKGPPKDLRPSVHDSDGLLVQTKHDEWTWRPYARQSYPSVAQIPAKQVLGFGVIQRNRDLLHYEDHNAQYHNRPSLWVTFDKPQTKGHVELLELVGAHEGVDNIGAYWVPDEKLKSASHIGLLISCNTCQATRRITISFRERLDSRSSVERRRSGWRSITRTHAQAAQGNRVPRS